MDIHAPPPWSCQNLLWKYFTISHHHDQIRAPVPKELSPFWNSEGRGSDGRNPLFQGPGPDRNGGQSLSPAPGTIGLGHDPPEIEAPVDESRKKWNGKVGTSHEDRPDPRNIGHGCFSHLFSHRVRRQWDKRRERAG